MDWSILGAFIRETVQEFFMGFSSSRPVQFTFLSKACKGSYVWNVLHSSCSGSSCCNLGNFPKTHVGLGGHVTSRSLEYAWDYGRDLRFVFGKLELLSLGKEGSSGSKISFCVVTGSQWGAPARHSASQGLCFCNQGSLELTTGTLLPLGHVRVLPQNVLHVHTSLLVQINFSLILRLDSKYCSFLSLLTSWW